VSASAGAPVADERVWLQRAVLVLVSPRQVFASLRDEAGAASRAREESVLALVFLAGIGTVLWTPVAGRLLQDVTLNWLDIAVWAFLGGGLYGFAVYWVSGAIVHWVSGFAGGSGSSALVKPSAYRSAFRRNSSMTLISPPLASSDEAWVHYTK